MQKKTFSYRPGAFTEVFIQVGQDRPLKEKGEELEEEESSPIEDLMKEHGFIELILVMYQRMIDQAAMGQAVDISVIHRSAEMLKNIVSDHHEKDEELYIFPKFIEANYIVEIIDTLKEQHDRSRIIIKEMMDLSSRGRQIDYDARKRLINLCGAFVYMYLPHIAHEDTILYPTFYDIVSADYVQDIREKMEDEEERLLGETGFRGLIGRVSELEKIVGVHDIDQFTARL